jgi:hypothetical protein
MFYIISLNLLQMKADRAVGREDYGRPQCPTPGNWCLKKPFRKSIFLWSLFGPNLRRDSSGPVPKQVSPMGASVVFWRGGLVTLLPCI